MQGLLYEVGALLSIKKAEDLVHFGSNYLNFLLCHRPLRPVSLHHTFQLQHTLFIPDIVSYFTLRNAQRRPRCYDWGRYAARDGCNHTLPYSMLFNGWVALIGRIPSSMRK